LYSYLNIWIDKQVVDLSKEPQVERELMLIKINAERDKLPEV
jgi:acetolactate synthase-1/3 small subunit